MKKTFGRSTLRSELLAAAASGSAPRLGALLASGAAPMPDDSRALSAAARHGHLSCLELLIPFRDPASWDFEALTLSAAAGHAECVKLLIPVCDPMANDSRALCFAAENGRAECVRLLIPASNPKAHGSNALCRAARNGHAECAKLLIPASGPLHGSTSLHAALSAGQAEIVSAMFFHEPAILHAAWLPKLLSEATLAGHCDLSAMLAALIDQRAISDSLPQAPCSVPSPTRL